MMRPVRVTFKCIEYSPGKMLGQLDFYYWWNLKELVEHDIKHVDDKHVATTCMCEITKNTIRFYPTKGHTTLPPEMANKKVNDSAHDIVRAYFASKEGSDQVYVWIR